MKMLAVKKEKNLTKNSKGFSIPELLIVLLVGSIILVLALPQLISSRRLMKFSAMQRQVAASLVETRQEAMSQRKAITYAYDDRNKQLIIYGGNFGVFGDSKNKIHDLTGFGVDAVDIKYGRPGGVSSAALNDTTNMTSPTRSMVEITFQPDGSVIDASNNPQNNALFFYHNKYKKDAAFAVSILGAGGRIKVWRYSKGINAYVE
jgi:prepilin-type N-terminal cleavage/methylation domain-containing protein